MMRTGFGIFLVWILAALIVRGVFADLLTLWGVRPDLVTIVLVYWALASGPVGGTLGGFLAGLVADAHLGRSLGLQAGLLSTVGFLAGHAGRQFVRENPLLQGAVVGIGALLVGGGRAAVVLADGGAGALLAVMPLLLGSAVYSAVLAPVLYWVALQLGFPDPLARVAQEE